VEKFPFPTPPDELALKSATSTLINIGALEYSNGNNSDVNNRRLKTTITNLGRRMTHFPLNPRFAKMLILTNDQRSIQDYIIAIVSALTVQDLFLFESHLNHFRQKVEQEKRRREELKMRSLNIMSEQEKEEYIDSMEQNEDEEEVLDGDDDILTEEELKMRELCGKAKQMWSHSSSDLLSLLKAVGAYGVSANPKQFCREWFLHSKNMKEVCSLMKQLKRIIIQSVNEQQEEEEEENRIHKDREEDLSILEPPNEEQELIIRQIICAGLVDRVAQLATEQQWAQLQLSSSFTSKNRPYISIQLGNKVPVFIHPSSYLFGKHPEYVVYNDISKSRSGKIYMKGVTVIQPNWLTQFAKPMIKLSKPLDVPPPRFSYKDDQLYCFVSVTFTDTNNGSNTGNVWELPAQQVIYSPVAYNATQVYGVFARLILEGKVFKDLIPFKNSLSSSSKELEVQNSEKAQHFVEKLMSVFVDTSNKSLIPCNRRTLLNVWERDPSFLKSEYLAFVKEQFRSKVHKIWSPKQ
jgi:ATP-dependent RNA helicase DHX37/DHR1